MKPPCKVYLRTTVNLQIKDKERVEWEEEQNNPYLFEVSLGNVTFECPTLHIFLSECPLRSWCEIMLL